MTCLHEPKSFFTHLKVILKRIDEDIDEIKTKFHEPGDPELASKKLSNIQDEVETLKKEASELKRSLESTLAVNASFISNFKELLSETEVLVSKQEAYLSQYGFKPKEQPVEENANEAENENFSSPVKESSSENGSGSKTPNLLEYGLISRTQAESKKSSIEDLIPPKKVELSAYQALDQVKESTPTLEYESFKQSEMVTPPMYAFSSPKTPKLEL